MFPGQGSQYVGMGQALAEAYPEARAALDEADAALGGGLRRLMSDGPEEELKKTANTQPAILAVSVAAPNAAAAQLRAHQPPIIARVAGGQVVFDPRTVAEAEETALLDGIRRLERVG